MKFTVSVGACPVSTVLSALRFTMPLLGIVKLVQPEIGLPDESLTVKVAEAAPPPAPSVGSVRWKFDHEKIELPEQLSLGMITESLKVTVDGP